jgi:hypothetical protein
MVIAALAAFAALLAAWLLAPEERPAPRPMAADVPAALAEAA